MTDLEWIYVLMIEDGAEARDPREGSRFPAVSTHRSQAAAQAAADAYARAQLAELDPPVEVDPKDSAADLYFGEHSDGRYEIERCPLAPEGAAP